MKCKIKIAVSACLLGHKVRYDGKEKKHSLILDILAVQYSEKLEIIPFCPEVAIGLGVPRAKIQLVQQKDEQIRVLGVENHTLDVTEALQSCAESFLRQNTDLKAMIVKSKSPSCGSGSTPLFSPKDACQPIALSSGFFVQNLKVLKPELVIIEDTQFDTESACQHFLQNLY